MDQNIVNMGEKWNTFVKQLSKTLCLLEGSYVTLHTCYDVRQHNKVKDYKHSKNITIQANIFHKKIL